MNNKEEKKSKIFSDILILLLIAVFVNFGFTCINEYENCGRVSMYREGVTLYGNDAKITAYSTTVISGIWFIYAVFVFIKKWFGREQSNLTK